MTEEHYIEEEEEQKVNYQEFLDAIQQKTGWTQQEISERIRCTQSQVSKYMKADKPTEPTGGTAYLIERLHDRVIYDGIDLRGFTASGKGKIWISELDEVTISYFSEGALSRLEEEAYNKAKLYADPLNGGDWKQARHTLLDAGFEVLYGNN